MSGRCSLSVYLLQAGSKHEWTVQKKGVDAHALPSLREKTKKRCRNTAGSGRHALATLSQHKGVLGHSSPFSGLFPGDPLKTRSFRCESKSTRAACKMQVFLKMDPIQQLGVLCFPKTIHKGLYLSACFCFLVFLKELTQVGSPHSLLSRLRHCRSHI